MFIKTNKYILHLYEHLSLKQSTSIDFTVTETPMYSFSLKDLTIIKNPYKDLKRVASKKKNQKHVTRLSEHLAITIYSG